MPIPRTALGLAALAGAAALLAPGTALADPPWERGWRHRHGWYYGPPAVVYAPPPVVYAPPPRLYYAPPPVVYAPPPPVVYAPPPGISVTIPLR